MFDLLAPMGKALSPYLFEISTALIACILVLLGNEINGFFRKAMRSQHFIFRTLVFVLINAFGYGLIIVKATPYLAHTFRQMQAGVMFSVIMLCFIAVGVWAQRNRQI
ncbi:DUF3392 domain-containing protein [Vibrio sp. S4M6]|uniref:DUF3392 domain-containing protein n=1 Tax=Vibrio sinus TaxID=2946865 RepID=UPI00202AA7D7|nr:DUF3392 domain-containing protein [Vibrio sinus]MCL9782011.1 DUF3392 domain-containing protein [Vibrio sinus]